MSKVQSDFTFKWYGDRDTQQTFTSTSTVPDTIEFAQIDASGGAFSLTFPLVVDALDVTEQVTMTRRLVILGDSNLAANNVTLLPNGSGITLESNSSFVMDVDNQNMIWELVNDQWVIIANTDKYVAFASMGFTDNATDTVISAVNTYVDIEGTIVAGDLKRFTFSSGELTYTGPQTEQFKVIISLSTIKTLGAASIRVRAAFFIDTGSGFVEQGNVPLDMDDRLKAFSFSGNRQLSTGDIIKIQIKNEDNTDDILVVTYNLTAAIIL